MTTTLITATADRPEAFALTEYYVSKQTVKPDAWIILDDGNVPVVPTMGQKYVYCPECRAGTSMINKLKIAFSPGIITTDIAIFVEDDDALAPTWVETCIKNLSDGKIDIFGEGRALYYNVRDRWWFEHGNMTHASLCSTAVTKRLFPLILRLCSDPNPFIDDRMWKAAPRNRSRILDPLSNGGKRLVVGIKAMPGKVGYGGGHAKIDRNARQDPNGTKLIELIGTDCSLYDKFWTGYTPPQNLKVPVHTETGRVHGPRWTKWLSHLIGQPNITGLEIGTFRGESAEFMCENIFTHESARYICVDPFELGNPEHIAAKIDCSTNEAFARERLAPFKQCQIVKDFSENYLRRFAGELDFILVDGLHTAIGVLRDAVLSFEALKIGGVMVFDDYLWESMPRELDRPKVAIDAFLKCYADSIELLSTPAWQVAIKRTK
jgi:predicted O-methyltransferase YrrM